MRLAASFGMTPADCCFVEICLIYCLPKQLQANGLQPQRNLSPANSPIFRLSSLPGTTPFNRRVAIAYDTTASGRLLLKWAADNVLEPADNVFVVRAVPKVSFGWRQLPFGGLYRSLCPSK